MEHVQQNSEHEMNHLVHDNDIMDEEYDSPSDSHRMAAYHFKQAAMQHELAADAYDLGDIDKRDLHAFTAYRHQINAIQFAEISVMLVQGSDEVEDYQ